MMLCSFLGACQNHSPKYNNSTYRSPNNNAQSHNNGSDLSHYAAITQNPWKFIQTEINVDIPLNSRIAAERERILRKPSDFESITSRSEPYVYYIVNQLSQNNMPIELALIPLIESAYDPLATSPAQAAGLWQFVPITAKEYGLKRSNQFDARRDLIQSTNSAITLLQTLNSRFDGDWLLTLAAYNAGEGRVRKAIASNAAKGLPTDYWSLNLPKETMRYVPKILAIIDIVKNNQDYNITLPTCSYENSLVRIDMRKNISLTKIAKYAGIPFDDLVSFNAGYVKQTVNGPFHLLIPYVYAENLFQKLQADNLVSNNIVELLQEAPHNRAPLETPAMNIKYGSLGNQDMIAYAKPAKANSESIAKSTVQTTTTISAEDNYQTSNPTYTKVDFTKTESSKVVYSRSDFTQTAAPKKEKNKSYTANQGDNKINYLVKYGDNLYSIAQSYRVKIADIVQWNNLKNPRIKAGDILTINIASANPI